MSVLDDLRAENARLRAKLYGNERHRLMIMTALLASLFISQTASWIGSHWGPVARYWASMSGLGVGAFLGAWLGMRIAAQRKSNE